MDIKSYWYIARHALNPFRIITAWFMEKFFNKKPASMPALEPVNIQEKPVETPAKNHPNYGTLRNSCVLNRPAAFKTNYSIRLCYDNETVIAHCVNGQWVDLENNVVPKSVAKDAELALFEYERSHLMEVQANTYMDWGIKSSAFPASSPSEYGYHDRAYDSGTIPMAVSYGKSSKSKHFS